MQINFAQRRSERGSILFLILLAVVLFAALSYAVTSSMRGGGKDASTESAQARAGTVLQWFTTMETTINRMMLVSNVKDYELNFFYNTFSYGVLSNHSNPNCTSSSCNVFDPSGGAMRPINPSVYRRPGAQNDQPYLVYRPLANLGTSENELVVELIGVDWALCQAVNAMSGITSMPYGLAPMNDSGAVQPYVSNAFVVGGNISTKTLWNGPSTVTMARTFCYCGESNQAACVAHAYYPRIVHVLLVR